MRLKLKHSSEETGPGEGNSPRTYSEIEVTPHQLSIHSTVPKIQRGEHWLKSGGEVLVCRLLQKQCLIFIPMETTTNTKSTTLPFNREQSQLQHTVFQQSSPLAMHFCQQGTRACMPYSLRAAPAEVTHCHHRRGWNTLFFLSRTVLWYDLQPDWTQMGIAAHHKGPSNIKQTQQCTIKPTAFPCCSAAWRNIISTQFSHWILFSLWDFSPT